MDKEVKMNTSILEQRKQVWEKMKPDHEPDWMNNPNAVKPFSDISSEQAEKLIEEGKYQVLDVRFQYEYNHYHIPEAILIPLPELEERYMELDPEKPTIVVCEHGVRSVEGSCILNMMGLQPEKIYNLDYGMSSYRGKTDRLN